MNVYIVFITFIRILRRSRLGTFSKLLILSSYQSTTPTITVSGRMAQYLTLSTTLRSRSPENSYHGSLPEIISNPFNNYCGSAALVWILVEVEVCMVHCSLTRSGWYSLFLANRKWEKVSTAFWHGKGLLVSTALTGMERVCTVTTGKGEWLGLWPTQHPAFPNHRGLPARRWQELKMWLAGLERWQTVRGCQLVRRNRMEGWDRCWHQREGTNQARRMVEEVLVQVESVRIQSLGLVGLQLA